MACTQYDYFNLIWRDTVTGQPCGAGSTGTSIGVTPTLTPAPSVNTVPPIISPSMTTGGVLIQSGQSWLEDVLNTILGVTAVSHGATHIPSTAHTVSQPQPQIVYQPSNQGASAIPTGDGSTGGKLGSSIESFIANNTGILLIAIVGIVLFKSGRR